MRNLWLLQQSVGTLCDGDRPGHSARPLSIDTETQVLHAVDDGVLVAYDLASHKVLSRTALNIALEDCVCVGLQYLQLDQAVCVAFGHGELFLCTNGNVECVGDIDVGIAAVEWAPDQELLVVINCEGSLLVMTREFDVLSETPLETDEFGVETPINVGWGKRETQFQGKAGKASIHAAQPNADVPADDSAPRVSWRGDGEYFVTSTKPKGCPRRLRVWDRNGVLQSTSEQVNGLEQSLTWRPSGNVIVSTQRLPQRHDVVFFERNGLRHGEFTLPFGAREVEVIEMAWNCDSTVLAIWIQPLDFVEVAGERRVFLQLWTTSNYHWYLKQELRYRTLQGFAWDPEIAGNIAVVANGGEVHFVHHDGGEDRSVALHRANRATVAVHDGGRILLTSFRSQCVPPPMCSEAIELASIFKEPCCGRLTMFFPNWSSTKASASWAQLTPVAVLSSHDRLAIILTSAVGESDVTVLADIDLCANVVERGHPASTMIRQACWTASREGETAGSFISTFLCIAWVDGADEVIDLDVEHGGLEGAQTSKVIRFRSQKLPTSVIRIQTSDSGVHDRSAPIALLSLSSGEIMSCTRTHPHDDVQIVPWVRWMHPPEQVVKVTQTTQLALLRMVADTNDSVDVGFVDLSDDEDDADEAVDDEPSTSGFELALVTLSSAGHLCINGQLLASNCNSFAVHDSFLLYATHNHACHFLSTRTTPANAVATIDTVGNDNARNLERGSRIVTTVPFGTRVVLQMPRGNLEVISPRPLLLVALQTFLDSRDYRRAFLLARKHRLNLNLLYDRNPTVFDGDIVEFLRALGDPTYVNVFLSDLRDEDHAAVFTSGRKTTAPSLLPGKRDRVCDAVRAAILSSPEERSFLLTVVHSLVCRGTPLYEHLLEYLRDIKVKDKEDGPSAVDRALKYAAVVVKSTDILYDAALGTYDFDLVIMVAKVAQKDPKEYLAFLEELSKLPDSLRKHRIDVHLKRFERALENLAAAGDEHFQECLNLIEARNLHAAGLRIFQQLGDGVKIRAVQALCATHMRKKNSYREAGLLFQVCGEDECALEAFTAGLEWRWAMIIAAKVGYDKEKMHAVAADLVKQLEAANRFGEAATLATEYLDDHEYVVVLRIAERAWSEALRVILSQKRQDLLETHLKPAVVTVAEELCSGMGLETGLTATLLRHRDRLEVVRTTKVEQKASDLPMDEDVGPQSDLYSDTSSRASTRSSTRSRSSHSSGSRSSRKTHRSKRRDRAKQTSLREGGMFEEVALLDAINTISQQAEAAGRSAPDLCSVLHFLGLSPLAARIEATLDCLHKTLSECHEVVWSLKQIQRTTLADPEIIAAAGASPAHHQQTANASAEHHRGGGAFGGADRTAEAAAVEGLVVDLRTIKIDDVVVTVPPRLNASSRPWQTILLTGLDASAT